MRKCIMLFLMIITITILSFPAVKRVRVIVDKAVLYSYPKTSSEKIDIFEKGTILDIFGSGEKRGWYNVSGRSQYWGGIITGFIRASEVELIDETPIILPEATETPPKIKESAKPQEAKQPKEEKPAKEEERAKVEVVAKPPEIMAAEKIGTPVSTEKKPGRKSFSIRLGYNAGFATQNASISWSREIYYEDAVFGVSYSAKKGNSFCAALGYKFARSLGIEIGVDVASRNLNANYDASIPHPLRFNSPREAQSGATYKIMENAAFINLVLTVPSDRFGLDIFAGPAYFFSSAELVRGIDYSQSYPYSSITISAQNQKLSKNVFGFNGGASVTVTFTPNFGVFLSGQYFSGSADFRPSEVPGLKLSLGGLKAGGGIKLSF
jgi:hypothetical protein